MKLHVLPVGPIQANCYILCDEQEKKCAVIDPGGEGAKVARAVGDGLRSGGHFPHSRPL